MITVPGWVVVAVMVVHAMLVVFNDRIDEVTSSPLISIALSAIIVGLNVLSNAVKPLTTALRTLTRRGQ